MLLHVGAADQVADVYLNRQHLAHHEGGYDAFTVDLTDALAEENLLHEALYVKNSFTEDDIISGTIPAPRIVSKPAGAPQ